MPRSPLTSESAVLCGELGSEWLVGVLAPAPDTLSRFVSWNIITSDSRYYLLRVNKVNLFILLPFPRKKNL